MVCGAKTALLSCAAVSGISQGVHCKWPKQVMNVGKKRLAGDTARAATTGEVKDLRRDAGDLTEVVAEQTLELRLLIESMTGPLGDAGSTHCR